MNDGEGKTGHGPGTAATPSKKEATLRRAQADQAVKGQPTSGVDDSRDEPAADADPKPQGQTNQTR